MPKLINFRRAAWAVLSLTLLAPSVSQAGDGIGFARVSDAVSVPVRTIKRGLHNVGDRLESSYEWVQDCRPGLDLNLNWRLQSRDHGWSVPRLTPVQRAPVVYRNYWPRTFHGQPTNYRPPVHPTVYTPTDTTQLGYYYTPVPTWQPNRAMRPPAPWPAFYHDRSCPPGGYCPHSVAVSAGYAPAFQPQAPNVPPTPTPADEAPAPKTASAQR